MRNDKIDKYVQLVRQRYPRSSNPIVENALYMQRQESDVAIAGFYELVRNVSGTGDEESPVGSWKEYWVRNGDVHGQEINQWPTRCSVCNCHNPAEHGAHLRDSSGTVSIVPLCAAHNNPSNRSLMVLRSGTIMVPVFRGGR